MYFGDGWEPKEDAGAYCEGYGLRAHLEQEIKHRSSVMKHV